MSIARLARALFERQERPANLWALVFYVLLLIPTLSLLAASEQPWLRRLVAVILVIAFVALDWAVIRRYPEPRASVRWMVGALVALLVLTTALTALEHSYILLFLFVIGYAFRYLPVRWGFVVGVAAVILIVAEQIIPTLPSFSRESLIQAATRSTWILFALLIVGWIAQLSRVSRERQRVIDELKATQGRLAATERQAGVLEERARLAREIHDTLAQGLVSIVMHLEAAEQTMPPDASAVAQHLDQARRAARDNLAEARRFVWALQPQALEREALPGAITRAAEHWMEENHVPVAVSVTGRVYPLAPEFEVTLLRAAQEALVNVSKHASARHVNLTLSYMNDQVVMDVNDDGSGFDPAQIGAGDQTSSFGLTAMRQRVERLGGHLTVESAAGEGTTLVVEIPVASSE